MSSPAHTIQIRDAETGTPRTFKATPGQLSGINPGDEVLIKFSKDGQSLIAEEIKKLR